MDTRIGASDGPRRALRAEQGGFSGMPPVKVLAASELVLEQIRTAIMLGRFRPGETLPPERQLAQFLGVSRTTVRGALAILSDEGVIEIKRGRGGGLFVKERRMSPAAVRTALNRNRSRLQDVFDFRVAVESACARLAAQRRTTKDLRALKQLLAAMAEFHTAEGQMPDDPVASAEFHSLDTDFHLAVAASARSEWLLAATMTGRVEMFRPIGGIFNQHAQNAGHLHEQIVHAIELRDDERAGSLMADHIEGTRQVVVAWLDPRKPRSAN